MNSAIVYKDFEIRKHVTKRAFWRVYQGGEFRACSSRLKDAKARIDFCLKHKIWKT